MYIKLLLSLLCVPLYLTSHNLYANDINIPPCTEISLKSDATLYAGHYYLSGMMEVGSELLLEPSGRFKWYLVVGGLDQYAEGIWWKNKTCIGLKIDKKYIKYLSIFPQQFQLKNDQLHVIWNEKQKEGVYIKAQHDKEKNNN